MPSAVTDHPAAPSAEAQAHFRAKLGFETDCSDVHRAMTGQGADFVLLDVRGPDLYAAGHLLGARNLPHGKMTALRLAGLGRPVKLMIGGVTGRLDEGLTARPVFARRTLPGEERRRTFG